VIKEGGTASTTGPDPSGRAKEHRGAFGSGISRRHGATAPLGISGGQGWKAAGLRTHTLVGVASALIGTGPVPELAARLQEIDGVRAVYAGDADPGE
jgi:hypothetical protein